LGERLEKDLDRLARDEGVTRTEIIREALTGYCAEKRAKRRLVSAADAMKGFIAAGTGDAKDLSVDTSNRILEILHEKKRSGRL
jgi:metal-responsive CopG/Arc/MetJ family transcriptional regulator